MNQRILVLGDSMIDLHTYCDCDRISPEAPVPIGLFKKEKVILGGAANVAKQVAVMTDCTLAYIDTPQNRSKKFLKLCDKANIDLLPLPTTKYYCIPQKRRIWIAGQQSCRIDKEVVNVDIDYETQQTWLKSISEYIEKENVKFVILSDYDKGFFSDILIEQIAQYCSLHKIVTILDPKRPTYPSLQFLSIVKANNVETIATNMTPEEVSKSLESTFFIHTLGRNGMRCYQNGEFVTGINAQKVEVSDSCGAGDTVASFLALSLMRDSNINEVMIKRAMKIASRAAALTVRHRGSYVLNHDEAMALLTFVG